MIPKMNADLDTSIIIGVSARHVHLCSQDLDVLFGKGYELQCLKLLGNTGQFAAEETVTLATAKSQIQNVRILAPLRTQTQIELAPTDAHNLGLKPPVRDSGNLEESAGLTIIGPKGSINLHQGVIIPARHVHLAESRIKQLGLEGKTTISVRSGCSVRSVIFEHVFIRPFAGDYSEMHIDTDEGNACMAHGGHCAKLLLGTAK